MHFRTFYWPAKLNNLIVSLPDPNHSYFNPLLAEAAEDGFDPAKYEVKGIVTQAISKNKLRIGVLAIGEQFLYEPGKTTIGPTLSLRRPDGMAFFFLTSWHTVVIISGNPTELHVKWTPEEGERKAFLNIEAIENRRQLGAMQELLDVFNSYRAEGGRPRNDAYVEAAARLVSGECKTTRQAYEMMIAEMEDSPEKTLLQNNPDVYKEGFENFKGAMKYQKRVRRGKLRRRTR